jgi:hypothetical protein
MLAIRLCDGIEDKDRQYALREKLVLVILAGKSAEGDLYRPEVNAAGKSRAKRAAVSRRIAKDIGGPNGTHTGGNETA